MLLSALIGKELFLGKTYKGVCRGVGISLKTYEIKYLFCASAPSNREEGDFVLPFSAVASIGETVILSKARPAFPKSCAKLFLRRPVYDVDGVFLGELTDADVDGYKVTSVSTSLGLRFSSLLFSTCADAILLKKELPYPIGQRVPAPVLSALTDKTEGVVTKSLLRLAIEKGALVKLTLSLPPFHWA